MRKQFEIVSGLLNRADVETIYVCTDSGREGEYIYRLVAQMAGVKGKKEKTSLDRFPDRRRDHPWNQRSQRPECL